MNKHGIFKYEKIYLSNFAEWVARECVESYMFTQKLPAWSGSYDQEAYV